MAKPDPNRSLRKHLVNLLEKAEAHADARSTLKDFPATLRGKKPAGSPHTPWQLLEHMRLAQWDILKFSVDARHVSPKFPEGYWPRHDSPPDASAWNQSAKQFLADLRRRIPTQVPSHRRAAVHRRAPVVGAARNPGRVRRPR